MKIKADDLAKEVGNILAEYQEATFDTMKKAVDKAAKDSVMDLKTDSPKRTGAYAQDWTSKNNKQTKQWAYAKVVYNKRHYRLTHLLEKGHKVVNAKNGRTWVDASPHIADVEKEAVEELVKEIKGGV